MSIPNARKSAAHDLAERTGMKYTDALVVVTPADSPRQPRDRWQLTDELRAFFAGQGWRGVAYGDLYDWVDGLRTRFECDWCYDDVDARTEDASLELVVAGYDPDLSPQTGMLTCKKYHARCKPSKLSWAFPVPDLLTEPYGIELPASAKPEMAGEFKITARPVLHDEPDVPAMLLLTATVTEDHGQGAAAWINELGFFFGANGFASPDSLLVSDEEPEQWSVRIATNYPSSGVPQWLGVRTGPLKVGQAPNHFFLGMVDLPEQWVAKARTDGEVLVCFGSRTEYGEVVELVEELGADELIELIDDHAVIARSLPIADEHRPEILAPQQRSEDAEADELIWPGF
jgi:hypothetical protein